MTKLKQLASKRAVDTRRLYQFEEHSDVLFKLHGQLPIQKLRRKAVHIWTKILNNSPYKMPYIRFGPGVHCGKGVYHSYYHWYDKYIELSPTERDYITLTHELIHANGQAYHDNKFVRQEFGVFIDCFGINPIKLCKAAVEYNLSYTK